MKHLFINDKALLELSEYMAVLLIEIIDASIKITWFGTFLLEIYMKSFSNPLLNMFHIRYVRILVEPLRQAEGEYLARCHREEMILYSENKVIKLLVLAMAQSKNFSLMEHVVDVPWDPNSCISQLRICIKNTFGSNTVCSCKANMSDKWCGNYKIIL